MTPSPPGAPGGEPYRSARRARRRRWAAFVVGALLLAGAVGVVARSGPGVAAAWGSVARRAPGLLVLAAALPLLNWLLSAAGLWALTNRYGRVPLREMALVVGSGWLLNYLPLRPGLFGRIAYHKAVNGVAVRDSAKVLLWSIACGAAAMALLGVALALTGSRAGARIPAAAAPLVLAGAATAAACASGWAWWRLLLALTLRYIDTLVWTARYLVAFALLGAPIGPGPALVIAAAGQAAMLVPLTGNGLGLREWAVGVAASALAGAGVVAGGQNAAALGLSADLLNRAAEVGVAIPVGLACGAAVTRGLGRIPSTRRTSVGQG